MEMPEEVVDLIKDKESSRFQATIVFSDVPNFTPVELPRGLDEMTLVFPKY